MGGRTGAGGAKGGRLSAIGWLGADCGLGHAETGGGRMLEATGMGGVSALASLALRLSLPFLLVGFFPFFSPLGGNGDLLGYCQCLHEHEPHETQHDNNLRQGSSRSCTATASVAGGDVGTGGDSSAFTITVVQLVLSDIRDVPDQTQVQDSASMGGDTSSDATSVGTQVSDSTGDCGRWRCGKGALQTQRLLSDALEFQTPPRILRRILRRRPLAGEILGSALAPFPPVQVPQRWALGKLVLL